MNSCLLAHATHEWGILENTHPVAGILLAIGLLAVLFRMPKVILGSFIRVVRFILRLVFAIPFRILGWILGLLRSVVRPPEDLVAKIRRSGYEVPYEAPGQQKGVYYRTRRPWWKYGPDAIITIAAMLLFLLILDDAFDDCREINSIIGSEEVHDSSHRH